MRQTSLLRWYWWPLLWGWLACGGPSGPLADQYLVIRQGNSFGYIDREGNVVIPPQFAYALPFSEGLGAVNVGGTDGGGTHMPTNGKWGFVDATGKFKINPQFFSPPEEAAPFDLRQANRVLHEAYRFSEGLAAARTEDRWVYIDTTGNAILESDRISSARHFSQGLANVCIDGLWGYINHDGEIVIPAKYRTPADFRDDFALVENAQGEKVVLNRLGDEVEVLRQYRIVSPFYEGYAVAQPGQRGIPLNARDARRYILVDQRGRAAFNEDAFVFDRLGRFGSGMCPALVGSKLGDPVKFPDIPAPTESPGGKWGFIDAGGHFVANPVYEDAKGFSEGIGAVKQGGLWAYVDASFNRITGFEFRWVDYFEGGIAKVQLGPIHNDYDRRYAYLDKSGEVIWIEPE